MKPQRETELLQEIKALQATISSQQALFDAIPNIVMEVDADKVYTWANLAGYEFFGKDVIGKQASHYFEGEQATYERVQSLFDGDESVVCLESWQRRKDGQRRLLAWRCQVVKDVRGNVTGAISTASDITERKQAEEKLTASEMRYRRLFEASQDGILILDAETGLIIDVNPFLLELLNFSYEEFVEKKIWDIGIFKDVVANQTAFLELRQDNYIRYNDLPLETANGQKINVEFISNVYLVNHQKVIQCNIRDMTKQRKAEVALALVAQDMERFNAELERSNKELEQFAYVSSHDLQEPLRAIAGMVQLLQQRYQGKLDERADEYIHLTVEAATRMQKLIDDLLTYSRVDRQGGQFEQIEMDKILKSALANLSTAIQESDAVVTHDPLPTLVVDSMQLTRVFQNLIGNGIKFRGERPLEVHIGAQEMDDAWRFEVRDNGIGIEPQYYERIFLIFQRLHGRNDYPGTGIGLSLCQKIVENHGGRIWVSLKRGRVPGSISPFHTGDEIMTKKSIRPVEILLVEDSPADVLITREAFEQARLVNTLHVVDDGVQALAFLRKEGMYASSPRPDLVLLDLNLPRKNGVEVLAEIKSDPQLQSIPIVILTTSHAEQDILSSYNLHANCYIVKPVGFEKFFKAVQSIQDFWFSVVTLPNEVNDGE